MSQTLPGTLKGAKKGMPYRSVCGPGVAIDPRVPKKRTSIVLSSPLAKTLVSVHEEKPNLFWLTCKYWRSESGQLTPDSPSSADHSRALTAAYVNLGAVAGVVGI